MLRIPADALLKPNRHAGIGATGSLGRGRLIRTAGIDGSTKVPGTLYAVERGTRTTPDDAPGKPRWEVKELSSGSQWTFCTGKALVTDRGATDPRPRGGGARSSRGRRGAGLPLDPCSLLCSLLSCSALLPAPVLPAAAPRFLLPAPRTASVRAAWHPQTAIRWLAGGAVRRQPLRGGRWTATPKPYPPYSPASGVLTRSRRSPTPSLLSCLGPVSVPDFVHRVSAQILHSASVPDAFCLGYTSPTADRNPAASTAAPPRWLLRRPPRRPGPPRPQSR